MFDNFWVASRNHIRLIYHHLHIWNRLPRLWLGRCPIKPISSIFSKSFIYIKWQVSGDKIYLFFLLSLSRLLTIKVYTFVLQMKDFKENKKKMRLLRTSQTYIALLLSYPSVFKKKNIAVIVFFFLKSYEPRRKTYIFFWG